MDQRDLVKRAQQGDRDAFALLAAGVVARLDGAARLILRDSELARDAVQDSMVRAWRDLPGLRDPDRFEAWVHRLTVNSCLDVARRRRRRRVEVELTPLMMPAVRDATADVADRHLLDDLLRQLDPGLRAVIVLHYYLGMPLTEVAVAMGIPVGTVKSRLNRALGTMRIALKDDEPEPVDRIPGGQLA